MSRAVWIQMVQDSAPFPISDYQAEIMFKMAMESQHRGETITISPGLIDLNLTNLYNQYIIYNTLRGEQHGEK